MDLICQDRAEMPSSDAHDLQLGVTGYNRIELRVVAKVCRSTGGTADLFM